MEERMQNRRKILVTSGGTEEYIDDFRILTNISSGALGLIVAKKLAVDFDVYYVCTRSSIGQANLLNIPNIKKVYQVRSVAEAQDAMQSVIIDEKIDAVIHAMAVSDFSFKKDKDIKCKSTDPEAFIEYMRQTIVVNPKIITKIKQWRPETLLVGFKFEIGLTNEELIGLAKTSIEKNKCDLVIANDKKKMKEQKSHVAQFVFSDEMKTIGLEDCEAFSKDDISHKILNFLTKVLL
jgi:phosphopantothenate-cysteine ligase